MQISACANLGTQKLITFVNQVSSGFVGGKSVRNLIFHLQTWLRGLYYDVK